MINQAIENDQLIIEADVNDSFVLDIIGDRLFHDEVNDIDLQTDQYIFSED